MCRKRPRSAREFCKQNSFLYTRKLQWFIIDCNTRNFLVYKKWSVRIWKEGALRAKFGAAKRASIITSWIREIVLARFVRELKTLSLFGKCCYTRQGVFLPSWNMFYIFQKKNERNKKIIMWVVIFFLHSLKHLDFWELF